MLVDWLRIPAAGTRNRWHLKSRGPHSTKRPEHTLSPELPPAPPPAAASRQQVIERQPSIPRCSHQNPIPRISRSKPTKQHHTHLLSANLPPTRTTSSARPSPLLIIKMARGNQRDKAREAAQKKLAGAVRIPSLPCACACTCKSPF